MKYLSFISVFVVLLSLSACNGFSTLSTDVHTPDATEADRPYEIDAGTDPYERVCPELERKHGNCG